MYRPLWLLAKIYTLDNGPHTVEHNICHISYKAFLEDKYVFHLLLGNEKVK